MDRTRFNGTFVIADRQSLIGRALKELLAGYGATVYEATERHGLEALLRKHRVALVIADYPLLFNGSMEVIPKLIRNFPETSHLVLTTTISRIKVRELERYGLRNIVLKTDDRNEFVRAVRSVLSGRKHYSRDVLDILLQSDGESAEGILLTPSELEIATLLSGGVSVREIAHRKQVGVRNVMAHRKRIYRKLGVTDETELKRQAIKAGLIDNIEYHI